jgi:hypothetical protein
MAPVPTDEHGDRTARDGAVPECRRDVQTPPIDRQANRGMRVGLRGFHLGIALDDSVCVCEGLAGIAVGGRGVRSRDGKARDHPRCRVGVGNGGAPRRRRVNAPRTASAGIVVADAIRAVVGKRRHASFLGG